jgi:hypothetical protein
MAKRKSKKLTIEEVSKEMINEDISAEVPPVEEISTPDMDSEITEVEFEEEPLPQKEKEVVAPPAAATAPKKPEGVLTLQEIGDRMRVIRAKKRSSDPKIQAEGTKELKDLNDELHVQEKKLKAFFGR